MWKLRVWSCPHTFWLHATHRLMAAGRNRKWWQRAWEHVVPVHEFPPEIRWVAYTKNAIESLNMQLRKIIKTRGHLSNDQGRHQAALAGAA